MIKTGKFLSSLRRTKGLTQEELGERIGVTGKTISRWETGKYLPPADMLMILGDFYGVTVNEILSGRRLGNGEYKAAAEENIKAVLSVSVFSVKEKMDFFKKKWKKDHVFELVAELTAIAALAAIGFFMYKNALPAAAVLWAVWAVSANNRMMAYAENKAFDAEYRLKKDGSTGG
ncbi:MAG: helix-turn-helix domain-containing protein [Ruminococcus sp.]|nr:helix-turn-helix domain-containing protein [Ruminococcus sp.]